MEKISSLFKRDTIFFIDEEKVCTDREVLQIIGKLLLEKGYVKESFGNALIEREEKYPTGLAMVPYPVAIPHTDPDDKKWDCVPRMIRKIAEELVDILEKDMKVIYPEREVIFLAYYLCDVRMMKADRFTKKEIEAIIEPRYLVIVEEMLNDIKNDFMLDLMQDEELFVDLVLHIRFSIKFGKDSAHQENPLLDTMKNRYPFVFELSTYIFTRFYEALGIELNENQLGYIAAHLGAALERLENRKTGNELKIAVCSNMNMGVIRLLMAKLHSLYTNMQIIGPYPVYDTERMIGEKPAMILTTTSSNLFRDIKIPTIRKKRNYMSN